MPPDSRDGVKFLFLARVSSSQHPEIPDPEFTLVISRSKQKVSVRIPTKNVNVTVTSSESHLTLHLRRSQVPKSDSLVRGAGSQHVLLRWAPLDVFNTALVTLQRDFTLFYERRAILVCRSVNPQRTIIRT